MKTTSPKEQALKKIRNSLSYKADVVVKELDLQTPILSSVCGDIVVDFAEKWTSKGGQFKFFEHGGKALDAFIKLSEENNWQNIYCWDEQLKEYFAHYKFKKIRFGLSIQKADVIITQCEFLDTATGKIIFSDQQEETISFLSQDKPLYIFATFSQIKEKLEQELEEKYNNIPLQKLVLSPNNNTHIFLIES